MNNVLKFKIFELHCFVQKTYSDMKISCDIAIYQENTSKYLISLGFLNKSYITYIEANKLEQELKKVISTEDKNPSLLHSRFDQFQQKVENINDLIKVMQNAR